MRSNPLRRKLASGEPTLSTRINSTWPSVIEALGHVGLYDYVEFVAEYAPFTLHDLDNLCRAAELYDLGTMIKVDHSQYAFTAQRAIGSGFSSVLFTDCASADDVRRCIQSIRPDTPEDMGAYGSANRRNSYPGYGGKPEYVQSLRDIVVAVMIEKKGAVDQLEQILSIPGVDMIQWGPADFLMNIGHPGEQTHPELVAAKRRVFETASRMRVAARAEIQSADEAQEYLDMGVRHFSIGTDIGILYTWWRENAEQLRKEIPRPPRIIV